MTADPLTDYQTWPHGYVALPTLLASAPALLSMCEAPKPLRELSARCAANEGHLAVAMRTLLALDWVARDADGVLHARAHASEAAQLGCLRELAAVIYAEDSACFLAASDPWAEAAARGWPDLPEDGALPPLLRQLLTGAVLTPAAAAARSFQGARVNRFAGRRGPGCGGPSERQGHGGPVGSTVRAHVGRPLRGGAERHLPRGRLIPAVAVIAVDRALWDCAYRLPSGR